MSALKLDQFLPYQLAVLASRVSRDFAQEYQRSFDISIPEWRVVAHLSQADRVSVREIHRKVDMDKSKVSRAASRLEARGYISKQTSSQDRRLVELELTKKGREMVRQIAPIAAQFEDGVLQELPEDQRQAFRQAISALVGPGAT